MNIELMAGPNLNMQHLSTVASNIDGTDPSKNTFSYLCLDVTPHAPIYFYQFTSPKAPNTTWTTRFTIAGSDGSKTNAPNATQPDGSAIPWGFATLTDPSQAVAAPAKPGSGSASAPAGNSAASLAASTPSVAPSTPSISAIGLPTSGAAPGPVSLPSSIVQAPSSSNVASGTSTPAPTSSSAASPLLITTLSIAAPLLSLLSFL